MTKSQSGLEIETCRHHAKEGEALAKSVADLGIRSTLITEGEVRVFEPRGSRSKSGSTRAYADGWEKYQEARKEKAETQAAAQRAQHDKAALS